MMLWLKKDEPDEEPVRTCELCGLPGAELRFVEDEKDKFLHYDCEEPYDEPLFGKIIPATLGLQRTAYGTDPATLEGDAFAEFVRFNALALHSELSEFLAELPIKPWVAARGRPGEAHRARAVEELVDCGHFLFNLVAALRVTTDEWETAYATKMQKNRDRMASGYQGSTAPAESTGLVLDYDPASETYLDKMQQPGYPVIVINQLFDTKDKAIEKFKAAVEGAFRAPEYTIEWLSEYAAAKITVLTPRMDGGPISIEIFRQLTTLDNKAVPW